MAAAAALAACGGSFQRTGAVSRCHPGAGRYLARAAGHAGLRRKRPVRPGFAPDHRSLPVRLARARESVDDTCSQQIGALATQVREVQEKAAGAIHEKGGYDNGHASALRRHAARGASLAGLRRRRRERGLAVLHLARPGAASVAAHEAVGGGKRPGRARLLRYLPVRHRAGACGH